MRDTWVGGVCVGGPTAAIDIPLTLLLLLLSPTPALLEPPAATLMVLEVVLLSVITPTLRSIPSAAVGFTFTFPSVGRDDVSVTIVVEEEEEEVAVTAVASGSAEGIVAAVVLL